MTTMHVLLFFSILAVILQNSLSVHPGDPFPTDLFQSKTLTSEDLINGNEIVNPTDDETPSPLEPLTDPIDPTSDEENPGDNIISTSTKFTSISKAHHKNVHRKKNLNKNLPLSSTTSTFIPKSHDNDVDEDDNLDEKLTSLEESSTSSSKKCISKKNLIKIGRWKHEDPQTKETRYWYELEGGRMGLGWTFDRFIFQAYNKSEPDTEPVYAFHSEVRSVWTNTIQTDPMPPIIGNDQWISDGVSFYAYKTSMNSTELQPVLRYWNKLKPGATDATETRITYLIIKGEDNDDEDRSEWILDKILFYALPIED